MREGRVRSARTSSDDQGRLGRDCSPDAECGQVWDPPTAHYDRRSLLVNHQLDRMDVGRYQWFIVGLCAMGYMLGLLWAKAFGLIAPPLQRELGFSGT
ncbi:hypothetical protein FRC12_007122 [Ceratobasidium sp. 428]|nr:hypothetical protein FRC12_007122 [Ceratobasidium sp. 428]